MNTSASNYESLEILVSNENSEANLKGSKMELGIVLWKGLALDEKVSKSKSV